MPDPIPYAPFERIRAAWGNRPRSELVARLVRTPDEVGGLIADLGPGSLAARILAWHDDNHTAQLRASLAGR